MATDFCIDEFYELQKYAWIGKILVFNVNCNNQSTHRWKEKKAPSLITVHKSSISSCFDHVATFYFQIFCSQRGKSGDQRTNLISVNMSAILAEESRESGN